MLYISIFLLLNCGCISQSYIMRPREKVSRALPKRHLVVYPEVVRLDEEAGRREGGGGGGGMEGCEPKQGCGGGGGSTLGGSDPKTKASNIAQKAAQEAKAANDAQMAAAEAAASQVKIQLAEKALQSARAAEAALAGKQQIMEQLDGEHREAEAVVQDVSNSLQNTQANAVAANDAANEAKTQLGKLKQLVQASIANLANIENVSNGAQQELAEKTQLLEAAKNRVESLSRQLAMAKQDFEKTKKAAYKAACSAVEAKQKAQRSRRRTAGPAQEGPL
ncbi:glycine, alanine and asparagine-rich protein-like [Drosophila montana]|uniref:glycine, alanine and asparagine-rich protein-like n=1 Tax=Drosophila montana TaxID=40370 RepID=UPI00313B7C2D